MKNRYLQVRGVLSCLIACLFLLFALNAVAETPVTAEVELTGQTATSIQWRLVGTKGGIVSKSRKGLGRIIAPLGVYRLDVKTITGNWVTFRQLEVEEETLYRVDIDRGVNVEGMEGLSNFSWTIRDEKNQFVTSVRKRWGFIPLPAGKYNISLDVSGQSGSVKRTVTVTTGQVTNLRFGTGVIVKEAGVPSPQNWMLKPADDKGDFINIQGRWGGALVTPGDYWLIFQHEGQTPVRYQRVTVKEDEIAAVEISSGFRLQGEVRPEYFKLISSDGDARLKSGNLDTIYAPAGKYTLNIKMPDQKEVRYAENIEIRPSAITEYSIDTGVQMSAVNEPDIQIIVHAEDDNKLVTRMSASQGFIPLPPGRYRLLARLRDQTPMIFRKFEVRSNAVTSLTVNGGVSLQVSEHFGDKSKWTLESVDDGTSTTISRRWGKALLPPGRYRLTLAFSGGVTVKYGELEIPREDWLNFTIDTGVHVDVKEAEKNSYMTIYRQQGVEPLLRAKLKPSFIPLQPGSYRLVKEARDSYVWGLPIEVVSNDIVVVNDEFLNLSHSVKAQLLSTEDTPEGFNIAKSTLGGRVVSFSSQDKKREWYARNLIDGFDYFERRTGRDQCEKSCGWLSQSQTVQTPEVTLGFYQDRTAWIDAIVMDVGFRRDSQEKRFLPMHVAILVSRDSPDAGFVKLLDARLEPSHLPQVITLPKNTQAKYVKIQVLSTYGGEKVNLGEIGVIESMNTPSIITDLPKDLARPENGGSIVWFSSQAPGNRAAQVIWQGDEHWSESWRSFKGPYGRSNYLPQDIVFGFNRYRAASIDHILIEPRGVDLSAPGMNLANMAKEVVIERSMQSPITGFSEIARVQLGSDGKAEKIKLNQKARFIKLRVVSTQGEANFASLGKVSIFESNRLDGYSILRESNKNYKPDDATQLEESLPSTIPTESEPNDQQQTANQLTAGQWMSGVISPLGEQDYYRLSLARSSIVTTQYSNRPFLQTQLDVSDAHGQLLYRFSPDDTLAGDEEFSLKMDAGDHYYRLTQATNSIVLVWDTSGSMEGSEQALEKAVMGFIDHIRPSEKLALVRFGGDVDVLTDSFSNDVDQLKDVAKNQFKPGGSTSLYKAILSAMELLEDQPGNKVIVLMSDGRDTRDQVAYAGLWQKVISSDVRIYSLGLGDSLKKYNIETGGTGRQLLDYMAIATYGRYWHADSSEQLASLYETVAKEVTNQATYQFKVATDEQMGLLDLSTRDNLLTDTTSHQFEVILDASGSMVSTNHLIDGRLKIDVAKDVLVDIVNDLPERSRLGFRVFGHSIKEYQPGDCQDSELIYSIDQYDKDELTDHINMVTAKDGTTPLSYSILQAARDLLHLEGRPHIVLVTDGQEYCGAQPQNVVRQILELGIDLRIDIVGMDLKKQSLQRDMKAIARMTQGEFYNIQSSKTFQQAIRSSLGANYIVKDAANEVIAHGAVNGQPVKLPRGTYHVAIDNDGELVPVGRVSVASGKITRVEIVKNGQLIEPSAEVHKNYTSAEWQAAKPAVIHADVAKPISSAEKLRQLDRIERQIIAAEVNRPVR